MSYFTLLPAYNDRFTIRRTHYSLNRTGSRIVTRNNVAFIYVAVDKSELFNFIKDTAPFAGDKMR